MTSFGWKRKSGAKVSRSASETFRDTADDGEDGAVASGDIDWLTLAPQKRIMVLEDAVSKSNRLLEEGAVLAEAERFWEALRKWDQALQLTPENEKIMDMKAQAYMQLNELLPALNAAERTLDICPLWWVAHQTLGRARLGLGEVRLAVKCFSRAIHLNPADRELWEEDLMWSAELMAKKRAVEQQAIAAAELEKAGKIVELHDENEDEEGVAKETITNPDVPKPDLTVAKIRADDTRREDSGMSPSVKTLPANYVFMRD